MEKVLGLDLGTNSIGWAIREINSEISNQIIDKGVLTFDKGVAEDKSGEHPMVQKRTEARGKRRNYQAEKYRKWELLEVLINEGMCPLSIDELNEWRYYTKGKGRIYPKSEKFIQWLRFDFDGDGKPDFERFGFSKHESYYLFRSLIIDETKTEIFSIEPNIIGRVLYQMVQRRGYNDAQNIDENEKDELSKTIKKGGGESGAVGADEIEPFIEKYKTLGAALYQVQKQNGARIRKRYNLRSHFEKELIEICKVQNIQHLYKPLWGAIIWQRPLRSQKGLVGVCTFENNKRRCPISHPLYEEYRAWVFINNLKIRPIDKNGVLVNKISLADALHKIVYPQFFKVAHDFKLSSIEKELEKIGFEITAKFPKDTKVISFSFLQKMKEVFEENWEEKTEWNDVLLSEPKKHVYNIEDFWHLHFTKIPNKKTGEDPVDFLKRFALEKLKLSEDKADLFSKIRLQQGYATLSLSAIKKILPFLHRGFIYSEAVYLANLHKVIGVKYLKENEIDDYAHFIRGVIKNHRYEQKKVEILNSLITIYFEDSEKFEKEKNNIIESVISENFGKQFWQAMPVPRASNIISDITDEINKFLLNKKLRPENHFVKSGRLHDRIFNALLNEKGISPNNIKYLWHPSEQETYLPAINIDGKYYLGSPEPISRGFKNPMALKTMHKLKKLINYLIKIDKIDKDTRVVIEIARELNDANKRKAIEKWQRDREAENNKFKKEILKINAETNSNFNENDKNLLNKIRLWEEQKYICLYTGKTIGLIDLLVDKKYDVEHTIPASMSFDNELKNLTISDKLYNQQIKSKKLPTECPNYETEINLNGIEYPSILKTMQIVFGKMTETEKKIKGKVIIDRRFERIEKLESLLAEWKAKKSDDKEIKDNIIIRRHLIKMELEYWKRKLQTFTITEYKASWRNSQLRDTQTITKYALPYLKTVFNKVEVQKGNITSDFRKIFQVQPKFEKKERTKHSHHAIDAAVLTLIPPAAIRDKILLEYNLANEKNQSYHINPKQWVDFRADYILSIEDNVLINYLAENKALMPTYKVERKRGKIQYVKEKLLNGKLQFKLDSNGMKIPLKAVGDSIRGQLHEESFYSASKQPKVELKGGKYIPIFDGNGSFIFQKNLKRNDEIFITKKIPLIDLKSYDDLDIIVDPNLKLFLQNKLKDKVFSEEILKPIWAFNKIIDKNGLDIGPLRHIRCKVKGGGGGFIANPAVIRQRKEYLSKKDYKNYYYAQNGETIVCALYQIVLEGKPIRELKPYSILDISKISGISNIDNSVPINIEKVVNKVKVLIPLLATLKIGQKVVFYDKNIDELKDLNNKDLSVRLYNITKFEEGRVTFKHHLNAMKDDMVSNEMKSLNLPPSGCSKVNLIQAIPRLRLSQSSLNIAIEGCHFDMSIDGEILWR